MPGATGTNGDNEVVHDFSPLLLVYKSGRLERPLIMPFDLPGHDAATGVESKDVPLSPSTFVRLYLPAEATSSGDDDGKKKKAATKLPVVVYFHGGGFVMGSAGSCVYHRFVNDLVAASPAVAVSVDYRLAPEHMLPAAYEDSLAALKWVLSATDTWLATHGDLARVFLVGDSAGGNICHHLAMHPDVKQGAGAGLKGIVLIHPWFWGKEPIGGEQEHRRPRANRAEAEGRGRKKHLWEFVCPGAVDGVNGPRMNPTAPGAPGLESLACEKAMVCVAKGDHLRWRGKAYADAVARAKKGGAPTPASVAAVARAELLADTAVAAFVKGGGQPAAVEMLESEGVGHVFFLLDPEMEEAKELLGRIAAFVSAR
ncbi:unnamed protein product [Miscanthus lutarioriparius]|uniref:Alpha/beta hydrolase fold-3 domain-containing protein n=1 Tax=Miscanthus lutarioriparius TaxID=422564 RepID=A0A811QIK7_9POAL|nr:unnamed protein product [Miscanthus lutarioriparius]